MNSKFDRRLTHVPHQWKEPLVDVVDTAEAVICALKDWEMEKSPELIVGLTRLVLEREQVLHERQEELEP
ncbi:MAG: hypothetical protein ACO3PY_06510 [Pontimonas sp.]